MRARTVSSADVHAARVLWEDGEPSDVSGDGGAAAEHAEGALALLGAAQLDVRVERGDDLVVERRGLERVKGTGSGQIGWWRADARRRKRRGRTTGDVRLG